MEHETGAEDERLDALLAALPERHGETLRGVIERRVARRLDASERRLRLAQEAGRIGTYEISLGDGVTVGSPRFFELFGLSPGRHTLLRDDWWAVIHPDDRERLAEVLRRNLRAGEGDNVVEYRIVADGAVRWIRSCDRIERDASGRAVMAYGITQDITERKLAEERIWRAAHHDPLTDLPNRLRFDDRLAAGLQQAGAEGRPVGLVMIDLDGLKATNDGFGHAAGDHLLRVAAQRLAEVTPAGGLAARLGGDEFAVLMPGLSGAALADWAERAVEALRAPLTYEGEPLDCGASAGMASFPENAVSPDGLLRSADVALCVAKQSARGRCLVYQPALEAELSRLTRRRDLRRLALAA